MTAEGNGQWNSTIWTKIPLKELKWLSTERCPHIIFVKSTFSEILIYCREFDKIPNNTTVVKQESDCLLLPLPPSPLSLVSKLWIQFEENYEYLSVFIPFIEDGI